MERLLDALDRVNGQAFDWFFRRVRLGHDGHAEARLGRFTQPFLAAQCGHLPSHLGLMPPHSRQV